jgi:ribonuclease R
MREVFKEKILGFLKHRDYSPLKLSQLAKELGISSEDYLQFKQAFEELRGAGRVVSGERNLVALPAMSGRVTGTFRANPKGFGFVTPLEPSSHGDLFIPPDATAEAMTGDVVAAKVVRKEMRNGQERCSGRVVEILERAHNRFVGTLQKRSEARLPAGQGWVVQPDGSGFVELITVDDVRAKNAKEKDKVVVEILSYPTERFLARGVIIEVLGKAGQYESEISSVVCQYHLPCEFNDSSLVQAHRAATEFNPENIEGRDDIRDKVIVTIDPPDAKDFDDAISLDKDAGGNWVLGIHIADVTYFVPAGTPLDAEAKNRGNSIYLPGRTIPMLPEMLSNGVCSLQPGQGRYVKSAYITYDRQGNVLGRKYSNSIMCSTERLTYQQVDRILKGHTKGMRGEVIELLRNMEVLARIIEKRREKAGMLHLDLPETELVLDDAGRVADACPVDTSYPHTIIEMFMVEANEAVATLLDRVNVPFMRRIHPEPDTLTMQNLSQLVRALGLHLPKAPDRAALQELLNAVKGRDCSLAINLVVLRSLARAVYSPLHIGHFALASKLYCHFTSPIRRYADLLVHRLLDCYLRGTLDSASTRQGEGPCRSMADWVLHAQDLVEAGKHITFTEERADDAERELKTVLILQMLSDKIGEELDCVVTGLTNFGVFVQSRKLGIEGLVQLADLGPDVWKYNQKSGCLLGIHSGQSVILGQPMKVRIVSVNVSARQLSVAPVVPLVGAVIAEKKGKRPKHIEKTGRRHTQRRGRRRR